MILIGYVRKIGTNCEPKNYCRNQKNLNLLNQISTFWAKVISLITAAILPVIIRVFKNISKPFVLNHYVGKNLPETLNHYYLKTTSGSTMLVISDKWEKSGWLRVAPVQC